MLNDDSGVAMQIAVSEFLRNHEGSKLISSNSYSAQIMIGGFTQKQYRTHGMAVIASLGIWLPFFLMISILRRREIVYLFQDQFGEIHIYHNIVNDWRD